MPDELLVRLCAPTLAGIKAANLFTCPYEKKQEMMSDLTGLNRLLADKGIRIIPLRYQKGRCLVYMYRPEELKRCLEQQECQEILVEEGYPGTSLGRNLRRLIEKFQTSEEFPHEIGLFLDYPVEDVKGFICHCGKCYKASGCWKVYGDAEKACRTFERYKKVTEIYCREIARGTTVQQLAVSKKAASL